MFTLLVNPEALGDGYAYYQTKSERWKNIKFEIHRFLNAMLRSGVVHLVTFFWYSWATTLPVHRYTHSTVHIFDASCSFVKQQKAT
jgi:hypothetical protein